MTPINPHESLTLPNDYVREARARAQREYEAARAVWESNARRGQPPLALSRVGQRQNAQEHMANALKIMVKDITIAANMMQARLRAKRNRVPEGDVEHMLARCRHDLHVAQQRVHALYVLLSDPPNP